jgi:hypothetical protein
MLLAAMDELWALTPGKPLFLVQGAGQLAMGLNWGDGTVTDPGLIAQYGLADPNPFFKALLKRPYRAAVAITPHLYPPSVTGLAPMNASVQTAKLERSIGHIQRPGYCAGADCQQFASIIGEIGSHFTDPRDVVYYDQLAAWLAAREGAVGPAHWCYWSFNANSGDTGGLVTADWQSLEWTKLQYLVERWGLDPWYVQMMSG